MEESWAQSVAQWVLTPALVTGALLALARLFDPPTRWARRLRSDIAIASALPDGKEKTLWDSEVEWQAARLREYEAAFIGWALIRKWTGLAALGTVVALGVLYPPINKPGEPETYGPADWAIMAAGGVSLVLYLGSLASGRDFLGRTPREIVLLARLRSHKRRWRKLMRLERERRRRRARGIEVPPKGTRLGFSTQVDKFGLFMRDPVLRDVIRTSGFVAADFNLRYRADLHARGVSIPPWPEAKPVRRDDSYVWPAI